MKKRILAIVLSMALSAACLTACGEDNKQEKDKAETTTTTTTKKNTTEQYVKPLKPEEKPNENGYWHTESTTTTTTTSAAVSSSTVESSSKAEPHSSNNPDGTYSYDVAGNKITLRTRVEDYIQYDSKWNSYSVDLVGISSSLGFYYKGIRPDEPESQLSFYKGKNTDTSVGVCLSDEGDQNIYSILCFIGTSMTEVNFRRNDIADESTTSYWISYSAKAYKLVNFEQIVIFTYLMENAAFAPEEDWMEKTTFPTTPKTNRYYIDK